MCDWLNTWMVHKMLIFISVGWIKCFFILVSIAKLEFGDEIISKQWSGSDNYNAQKWGKRINFLTVHSLTCEHLNFNVAKPMTLGVLYTHKKWQNIKLLKYKKNSARGRETERKYC